MKLHVAFQLSGSFQTDSKINGPGNALDHWSRNMKYLILKSQTVNYKPDKVNIQKYTAFASSCNTVVDKFRYSGRVRQEMYEIG